MSNERAKPYKTLGLALAVLILALIPRVGALDTLPTPDESRWVSRSADLFVDLLTMTPQVTIEDGVPGVTTRWTGMVGLLLNYGIQSPDTDLVSFLTTLDPEDFGLLPWMRLPTAIVTAVCVMVMYWLTRRMFGEWSALVIGVLLALEPFLIGLSHLVHTDALVSSLAGVAVLSLLAYLGADRSRMWLLLLAGAATGLALLSKSTALFLLPYGCLVVAGSCWRWTDRGAEEQGSRRAGAVRAGYTGAGTGEQRIRRALLGLAGWTLITLIVVVALWPSMWVDPGGAVGRVLGLGTYFATTPHESGNYFLGQAVDDPGALFYPVTFLFRVTPLTLIGMLVTPFLLRRQTWPRRFYLLALWAFVLLFIAFVTFGAKKMDRYVLPAIVMADILAGVGLAHLLDAFWQRWARPRVSRVQFGALGFAAILAVQTILLLPYAPYYMTYYNLLVGGTHVAAAVIPVGWGKSCDMAAHYLNQQDDAANLDVATLHTTSCLEPLFAGTVWSLQVESLNQRTGLPWYAADYIVIHANQVQRAKPSSALLDFFRTLTPEHVVRVAGFDYAWIYRTPQSIPENVLPAARCPVYKVPAGTVNFDNRVWLGNYAWGDANWQQRDTWAAGETAYLMLRWRTASPLPGQYKVFAHLYDSQGRLITQSDDLLGGWAKGPHLLNRPSSEIMNYLALTMPPATPPGRYVLAVGLYDAATGQRLGLADATGPARGTTATLGQWRVTRPATPPAMAELPMQHPLDPATGFPEGLTLLGYDLAPAAGRAGESLSVGLYWQAHRANLPDLWVELQLRDAADRVWATRTSRPVDDTYPTPQWIAGEIVRDVHDLTVDAAAPPGDLRLVLAVRTINPWIQPQEVTLTTVPIGGRQHVFQAPAVEHPLRVDLAQTRFLGYNLPAAAVKPGDPLTLTLCWQCLSHMDTSYKLFVHLSDDQGQVWGQVDRIPCAGECPTTSWIPDEVLVETFNLVPRPDTPPGTYHLAVGFYDQGTGARMPLADGAGDYILLDTVIAVQE